MLDHFNSKSGIKFKKTSQNKINWNQSFQDIFLTVFSDHIIESWK